MDPTNRRTSKLFTFENPTFEFKNATSTKPPRKPQNSFEEKLTKSKKQPLYKDQKNPFGTINSQNEDFLPVEEVIRFDTSESDDLFAPSPIMDFQDIKKRRISKKFMNNRINMNRKSFNDVFNADILFITDQVKENRLQDKVKRESFGLFDIEADRNTFKKVNILRYRENVFRAAARITRDLPPFPHWIYRDKPEEKLERVTFIVGGTQFQSFIETIVHIPNSKLATCVIEKSGELILFFDRDPDCFNYVLNFYRTGRLHAPSNGCLSFFEEELEFWGINEEFMEPCCYSQYMAYKVACNTLKKFSESKEKCVYSNKNATAFEKWKTHLYLAFVVGDKTIISQWYSMLTTLCIIGSIMVMFFGTSEFGRIDMHTKEFRPIYENESILSYFEHTDVHADLLFMDLGFSGYFMADIILRCLLSPDRFVFFTDTINWIDILATMTSVLSAFLNNTLSTGFNEAYIVLLKIPRMFRLFKLTANLKSGMDAIILTIRASSSDLLLVFLIVVIFVSFFGVLIFVVELVNEKKKPSKFKSIYIGIWWAVVTMTTVGYGDYTPETQGGYIVACACIITGLIINQLPVPIFLRNFSIYYNQATSLLNKDKINLLSVSVDPENLKESPGDTERYLLLQSSTEQRSKRFSVANPS